MDSGAKFNKDYFRLPNLVWRYTDVRRAWRSHKPVLIFQSKGSRLKMECAKKLVVTFGMNYIWSYIILKFGEGREVGVGGAYQDVSLARKLCMTSIALISPGFRGQVY
jgi:hypothetical protein